MPNIRNTSLSNGQSIYHKSLFDYIYESDDEDVTLKDILTSIDVSIATFEETVELNTVNLNTHLNNKNNPHETTKAHVGLDNVDNTADADKTVKSSMNVLDSVNDTATTFAFSKAGLDTTSWFAVWNNYELRAMSPAKVLSTIGALSVNGGVLNPEKFISREGHSSTWVYGRARALIRQTTYTGYNPILSMKTTSGSWEMGVYENNGFHLSYITDEDFNSYNNRQTVDLLYTDDGTLYVPKVDAELIGNAATATKLKTERTITIGNTSQKFDGSKDIRFDLGDVYSLPLASTTVRGGVKVGFSGNNRDLGVELSSNEQMYVRLPHELGIARIPVTLNSNWEGSVLLYQIDAYIYYAYINVHAKVDIPNGNHVFLKVNGTTKLHESNSYFARLEAWKNHITNGRYFEVIQGSYNKDDNCIYVYDYDIKKGDEYYYTGCIIFP